MRNERCNVLDGDCLVVRQICLAFQCQEQVDLPLGLELGREGGCSDLLFLNNLAVDYGRHRVLEAVN